MDPENPINLCNRREPQTTTNESSGNKHLSNQCAVTISPWFIDNWNVLGRLIVISALEQPVVASAMPSWGAVAEVAEAGRTNHVWVQLVARRQRRWIVETLRYRHRRRLSRWCIVRRTAGLINIGHRLIALILRRQMVISCRGRRCRVVGRAGRSCWRNVLHSGWGRRRRVWVRRDLIGPVRRPRRRGRLPCWSSRRLVRGERGVRRFQNCII